MVCVVFPPWLNWLFITNALLFGTVQAFTSRLGNTDLLMIVISFHQSCIFPSSCISFQEFLQFVFKYSPDDWATGTDSGGLIDEEVQDCGIYFQDRGSAFSPHTDLMMMMMCFGMFLDTVWQCKEDRILKKAGSSLKPMSCIKHSHTWNIFMCFHLLYEAQEISQKSYNKEREVCIKLDFLTCLFIALWVFIFFLSHNVFISWVATYLYLKALHICKVNN